MKNAVSLFIILFMICTITSAQSGEKKKDPLFSSNTYRGLQFRSIGPALASGRITDFAVDPENRNKYFVATASSGVWKTTNSGITWNPIFDNENSYSIGCITIDPANSNVIWVGSGENNSQRSVSYGDGVYRSADGGKSWKNVGLKNSEHIGKIIIDPRDSKVVYAAAQGPLWGAGGDRGLYKSSDFGETWERVLYVSENTGITDVVIDLRNPDILYAAAYQRRRHVFTLLNGGPESAIYKSTDAGENWKKLKSGLPGGDVGRIGLALSPVKPDIIYAIVEASEDRGGVFRSTDRGESWEKRSGYMTSSPQYYNEIVCDPVNPDRLYVLDTIAKVSEDGGKTFNRLGNRGRHVDDHALLIDPEQTDCILIGGDGGIYQTFDGGKNWAHIENLPITQFYRVAVDNDYPFYNVYGGTQDNNSLGGPARTTSSTGIVNSDWFVTQGGDGFESAVDPLDPNIIYAQSQYGWLVRYNKKTGERVGIKPQERKDDKPYRWNWDSPLIISPHKHSRLYFAANRVFKSEDMGNSWEVISDDLTRQIDRDKLKVMGKIWSVDAVSKNRSTSIYGNIVFLAESNIKEGLLFAGTDDGLINITRDGGKTWNAVSSFEDVPETTYVSCICPSRFDSNVVYASFDNHKRADFNPYVLKSNDGGNSWHSISSNLPENGPVYSIAQDHVTPELLFAGAEFGFFFSPDEGENWIQLKSGLPTIAIKDIDIQRRENDLALASFGRGFYILDDYTPLRLMSREILEKDYSIFPVKDALMFVHTRTGTGSQGGAFYSAPNPEYGAVFTYYVKESFHSKKQLRKEKEKINENEDSEEIYYPNYDELKAEDQEIKPYLIFVIRDSGGNVVRRLKASGTKGIHRINWDFRYSSAMPASENFSNKQSGILALPGNYSVSLSKYQDGEIEELLPPVDFVVKLLYQSEQELKDRTELFEFQNKLVEVQKSAGGLSNDLNSTLKKILRIKTALKNTTSAPLNLLSEVRTLELKLLEIKTKLNGDETLAKRSLSVPPSISDRISTIYYESWRSASKPTQTHLNSYLIARDELGSQLELYKYLVEVELSKIEVELDKYGAPYTPGRIPKLRK